MLIDRGLRHHLLATQHIAKSFLIEQYFRLNVIGDGLNYL